MSRTHILRSLPRLATGAAVLALGLGGLTACGGGGSGSNSASTATSASVASSSSAESSASASSDSGGSAQSITATETNFKIALSEDHLKAGTVTIKVVNNGNATHDLAVEANGTTKAKSARIGPGGSTTLTVALDAGKYVFYCSIGNHRAMGMQLTVQVT